MKSVMKKQKVKPSKNLKKTTPFLLLKMAMDLVPGLNFSKMQKPELNQAGFSQLG